MILPEVFATTLEDLHSCCFDCLMRSLKDGDDDALLDWCAVMLRGLYPIDNEDSTAFLEAGSNGEGGIGVCDTLDPLPGPLL